MKAECTALPQQGIKVGSCQPFSAVGVETVLHQKQIILKLLGVVVGRGSADRLAALLKFVKHVGEEAEITFCGVVWPPGQVHTGDGAFVLLQARKQFFRNTDLPAGGAELVAERLNLIEIFAEN